MERIFAFGLFFWGGEQVFEKLQKWPALLAYLFHDKGYVLVLT
jgi:hypothetical protein